MDEFASQRGLTLTQAADQSLEAILLGLQTDGRVAARRDLQLAASIVTGFAATQHPDNVSAWRETVRRLDRKSRGKTEDF